MLTQALLFTFVIIETIFTILQANRFSLSIASQNWLKPLHSIFSFALLIQPNLQIARLSNHISANLLPDSSKFILNPLLISLYIAKELSFLL